MKVLSVAVAAAGLTACAALIYKLKDKKPEEDKQVFCSCHKPVLPADFTITAHTGCMGTKPNSLDSICAGDRFKSDIVEFDLRFDPQGTPVLWHDAKLSEFLVTLEKAFELISELKNLRVNIDVKETTYLEKIPPLAEKYGITDRIFFTGIGKDDVAAVKEKCPGIPYYLNYNVIAHDDGNPEYAENIISALKETGAIGLNTIRNFVTPSLVKAIQDAGYLVSVWTATTEEEIRKAASAGPNNITTRNPQLAYQICR